MKQNPCKYVKIRGAFEVKQKKSLRISEAPSLYPEEYLFSNQFMEDLGKIYRLKKYFPTFDDEKK